jgi:anti-anti-sigma factor
MATGTIFYARHERTYVLKLVGELRYTLSESFNAFLDRLFKRQDFDNILIDLTEAQSIDSTMLGLLAKIASFMRARFDSRAVLVCDNPDINQLLDSLGFYGIFTICEQGPGETAPLQRLTADATSADAMAATILEAHSILSEVNDCNKALFRDVIDALQDKPR